MDCKNEIMNILTYISRFSDCFTLQMNAPVCFIKIHFLEIVWAGQLCENIIWIADMHTLFIIHGSLQGQFQGAAHVWLTIYLTDLYIIYTSFP